MFAALATMVGADLLARLRDRSAVIFGLLVPFALMVVLNLVFGNAANSELKPVTVSYAAATGDTVAQPIVQALTEVGLEVNLLPQEATQVREAVRGGTSDLGLIFPDDFGASFGTAGTEPLTYEVIQGPESGLEVQILTTVATTAAAQVESGSLAATAGQGLGLNPAQFQAVAQEVARTQGVTYKQEATAKEQLSVAGALVAGQAGMFMLFTVSFGILALNTEREQGTLARLQSMPIPGWLIPFSKALTSVIMGCVATGVLLVAGGALFKISFGQPVVVGLLVFAAVAAATSVSVIIGRVAGTAEQAGMMQTIVAVVLGIAGGSFFPVPASGWVATLLGLNPVSAFIRGLGITAGGGGLGDVAPQLLILAGFAVVMVVIGRLIPQRGSR